jgi:hypothetical protein
MAISQEQVAAAAMSAAATVAGYLMEGANRNQLNGRAPFLQIPINRIEANQRWAVQIALRGAGGSVITDARIRDRRVVSQCRGDPPATMAAPTPD